MPLEIVGYQQLMWVLAMSFEDVLGHRVGRDSPDFVVPPVSRPDIFDVVKLEVITIFTELMDDAVGCDVDSVTEIAPRQITLDGFLGSRAL